MREEVLSVPQDIGKLEKLLTVMLDIEEWEHDLKDLLWCFPEGLSTTVCTIGKRVVVFTLI